MSVKPELTLICLKESRRYQFAECPIGTFIVRLYWADYSKYVPSQRKLDGVYLLKDTKTNFHRVCEFAITSLESLEYLVANCSSASGIKGKWFQKQTAYALMKFRGFAQTAYQFVKPIKVAVQAAVAKVKQTVSNAVESGKETIKKVFRRPFQYQPQSFAQCTTLEQAVYLFSRCPEAQMKLGFIDNFYSTLARVSPKTNLFGDIWDEIQEATPTTTEALADVPQYGLTLDDIAPALVEQRPEVIEHIPASDRQVRQMMADGYKANARRCKQWVIGVGKSIPGFEIVVKGSDKRKAEVIMQQIIDNILLAQLSVSELCDIIAAG